MSVKGGGENVTKQIPRSLTKLHSGSVVILYTDEDTSDSTAVKVPSVRAKTYEQAKSILEEAGLKMSVSSNNADELDETYVAISQSPSAQSYVARDTIVYVDFINGEYE